MMLLEVTPAILESLGIGANSIEVHGSASLALPQGARRGSTQVRVVRLKQSQVPSAPEHSSTAETLPIQEMAMRMRCTRANVYDQEKRGRIFSVVPPGRQNGRTFPAFQLEDSLDRELLAQLIGLYAERSAPTNLLWQFLRASHEAFGGLSGIQVLTRKGVDTGRLSPRGKHLLGTDISERQSYVLEVALEDLAQSFT